MSLLVFCRGIKFYLCAKRNFVPSDIFPNEQLLVKPSERERLLNQKAVTLWMTGLSGSGKSTLAVALERKLHNAGLLCMVLDGDNVRTGLNRNLSFSEADRFENIRRIAEVSKLLNQAGVIVINAFISPLIAMRQMAAEIIGVDRFLEVYVQADLAICEKRDVKGLYAKARRGEIKHFTGIDAPYEPPENPAIRLDTANNNAEECLKQLEELLQKLNLKHG